MGWLNVFLLLAAVAGQAAQIMPDLQKAGGLGG
jgi:hypothetical protein